MHTSDEPNNVRLLFINIRQRVAYEPYDVTRRKDTSFFLVHLKDVDSRDN